MRDLQRDSGPSAGSRPRPGHRPLSPRLRPAAAALALSAVLAACAGPQDSGAGNGDGKPGKGGKLTVLNSEAQTNFDPARLYTSGGGNIPSLVFRTLTTRKRADGEAGTKVVPDLATGLGTPSKGATVWTYRLKKGLAYEDGSPITSATSSTAWSAPSPPNSPAARPTCATG